MVSAHGVSPLQNKVKAVTEWSLSKLKDKVALRQTLGFFSYYRKFVRGFATLAHPLVKLIKQDTILPMDANGEIAWTKEQRSSFETLKRVITSEPILGHPDWTKPFQVEVDACGHGLGAVLSQQDGDKSRVIMFASRSLTDQEGRYHIWEKELLALYWAMELWRVYLAPPFAQKFVAWTDSVQVVQQITKPNATCG